MKHKTLFPRTIRVLASLLLTMLCAIGCTQEDPSEFPGTNPNDSDEPIPVTIAFNGVETMFGPYGAETRNLQANKIHFSQEYDKTRMIETIVIAEPDTLQVPLDPSTRGPLASTTLRIVAYDTKNEVYQGTGVFTIDKAGNVSPSSDETLTLKQGQYIFHCFSPAGETPVSDGNNTVTVTLPSAGGTKDPMSYYAKTGTVTVTSPTNEGTNTVAIPKLKPQYCKLTLSVTAPKKTVTYESAKLTTTLYNKATFALPGGTVTSAKSSLQDLTFYPTSPTIYTYPGGTGAFTIALDKVIVDNVPKEIALPTNAAGLTMSAGNAYKVKVTLAKKNWIQVSTLPFRVAKGNLIGPVTAGGAFNKNKDGTPDGDWTIGSDQGWYSDKGNGGDYFNWGVSDPLCAGGNTTDYYTPTLSSCPWGPVEGIGDTYKGQLDDDANPCYKALGEGWHVPTPDETAKMIGIPKKWGQYKTAKKAVLVNGQYFGTAIQPIEANQDIYVFLPAAGLRWTDSGALIEYSEERGHYWSTGVYGKYEGNAVNMFFDKDRSYGGWTMNHQRAYGMNIRCVTY